MKGPIFCECGNEKPKDRRPGCLECRRLDAIRRDPATPEPVTDEPTDD